jgi:hypothetical protein
VEERLRRSAHFRRRVAAVAFVVGVIGSVFIAPAAARVEIGTHGRWSTDPGEFIGVFAGLVLVLALSLWFFLMPSDRRLKRAKLDEESRGAADRVGFPLGSFGEAVTPFPGPAPEPLA